MFTMRLFFVLEIKNEVERQRCITHKAYLGLGLRQQVLEGGG